MANKSERAIQDPDVMNVPNEEWLPDSLQLYKKLSKLTDSCQWQKLPISTSNRFGIKGLFSESLRMGKILESVSFCNKKESKAVGVCQFGPLAEGPPGHAHGGAVATMIDTMAGHLVNHVFEGMAMTVAMNVYYKRAIPLQTAILMEAEIEEDGERKMKASSRLKSADGSILYTEGSLIFIKLRVPVSKL
ncbi:acyl-coenzyme A thioesterase THEM4-like [Glandiceps talaboti]